MVFNLLLLGLIMATPFYLPSDTLATPISPTPNANWEDTSILARTTAPTAKRSSAMTTVTFSDADDTAKDILFKQFVSAELTAGQTITGSQALKMQVRADETLAANNMFVTLGIRVIASDGSTVRKIVLAVTQDNVEVSNEVDGPPLQNRQFTATSAATNYTTVTGDYLVFELGTGGNPGAGGTHDSQLRLGDAAASDLSEDNTSTTDNNPWIELTDTLTFVTAGLSAAIQAAAVRSIKPGQIGVRQA